jgi:hypothetical protein
MIPWRVFVYSTLFDDDGGGLRRNTRDSIRVKEVIAVSMTFLAAIWLQVNQYHIRYHSAKQTKKKEYPQLFHPGAPLRYATVQPNRIHKDNNNNKTSDFTNIVAQEQHNLA